MEAMRYYTNPVVSISNDEAAKLGGKMANAQIIFYSRGCMHFIDMNAKIIAANTGRSIDNVVLEFHHLRQMKKPYGLAEWLELMAKEGVSNALEDYRNMAAGKLIIPATDSLGPEFKLVREDLERFSLGFSEEAFSRGRIIANLEPRRTKKWRCDAQKLSFMFQSPEYFWKKVTLVVEKEGKEVEVQF